MAQLSQRSAYGEVAERTMSESCWAAELARLGTIDPWGLVDMAVKPRRSPG